MITKNMKIHLLIVVFLTGIFQQDCAAKPSEDITTAGLVVAGVGLAVAGVASLVGWATSQSDEAYLESAQNEYNSIVKKYTTYYPLRFLDPSLRHNIPLVELSAVYHLFGSSDEAHLYEMACDFAKRSINVQAHCNDLRAWASTLASYKAGLQKRISQRSQSKYGHGAPYRDDAVMDAMCELRSSIDSLAANISIPLNFYTEHASYFALFDKEMSMMHQYKSELIAGIHADLHTFEKIVRSRRIDVRYPILSYVEGLNKDLHDFKRAINAVSPVYSDRVRASLNVFNTLHYIKQALISGLSYAADVRQQEQDKIEEERRALAKQQLETHKQEMRILKRQAKLKQKEIEQQERELRRQHHETAYHPETVECTAHVHVHI